MSYRYQTAFCIIGTLFGSVCLGQNYKCDWSVNGIGGGDMAGTSYKCGSTVGQTAAGSITGTNYWALIGFWQPETGAGGVREQAYGPGPRPLVTRLYAPQPNPARAHAAVRYALATETEVALNVHDLVGRNVRVLVNSRQKPGSY
ncbi:hypothetical protein JXD38_07325, partial [candidate division WOR-3 bacterium]|nr:hypothetical protein [candidate division WOR-3 bacterium]